MRRLVDGNAVSDCVFAAHPHIHELAPESGAHRLAVGRVRRLAEVQRRRGRKSPVVVLEERRWRRRPRIARSCNGAVHSERDPVVQRAKLAQEIWHERGDVPLNSTRERHTFGDTSFTLWGVGSGSPSFAMLVCASASLSAGTRMSGEKYTFGAILAKLRAVEVQAARHVANSARTSGRAPRSVVRHPRSLIPLPTFSAQPHELFSKLPEWLPTRTAFSAKSLPARSRRASSLKPTRRTPSWVRLLYLPRHWPYRAWPQSHHPQVPCGQVPRAPR